jgi:hypothetical protein
MEDAMIENTNGGRMQRVGIVKVAGGNYAVAVEYTVDENLVYTATRVRVGFLVLPWAEVSGTRWQSHAIEIMYSGHDCVGEFPKDPDAITVGMRTLPSLAVTSPGTPV